jgi:hypothetical protein
VGEEDALPRDREKAMPQRFIREDVVDAQINIVLMFLHRDSFAQKWKKEKRKLRVAEVGFDEP